MEKQNEQEELEEQSLTPKREYCQGLNAKHKLAIRLVAGGLSRSEAAQAAKISLSRLNVVMMTSPARSYLNQCLQELDEEFQMQFRKVVSTIEEALACGDMNLRLAAAALWLKTNRTQKVQVEITAEDVVQKLLKEEQPKDLKDDCVNTVIEASEREDLALGGTD